MRGNAKAAGAKVRKSNFNSRLYMRGNRCSFYFLEQKTKFQFTPLHERQRLSEYSSVIGFYFNSRLYMRGNRRRELMSWRLVISIHASTWEATIRKNWKVYINTIFQFTPLHERQRPRLISPVWKTYFNSRLYMRGNITMLALLVKWEISIHASTWEAACWALAAAAKERISIHASTWEAAYTAGVIIGKRKISIHASTWEAAYNTAGQLWWSKFQFTPLHERQRQVVQQIQVHRLISIHASTWEAAQSRMAKRRGYSISIHASTWEAAGSGATNFGKLAISIHASTWEAADDDCK